MSRKKGTRKNCYDGIDFQNLQIGPKGPTPKVPPKPYIMERVPCFGCILWCPKILQEMQAHDADNESLHTTKAIGKLLSEAVIRENTNMDWRNPFLLLDIVYGKGYKVKGEKDGSIMIPVMEKTTANNSDVPVNKRMWYLTVAPCCIKLGVEMLRRLPTTVMIWDAEKCPYEVVTEKSKFQGLIYLNTFLGQVNALIFHHEEISRERIRSMQGNFSTSELELFCDDYRRRLINNMVLPLFAVHLSKQSPCMPKPGILEKLDAAVMELVGESDEMDSDDDETNENSGESSTNVIKEAEKMDSAQSKSKELVDEAATSTSSVQPNSKEITDKASDSKSSVQPKSKKTVGKASNSKSSVQPKSKKAVDKASNSKSSGQPVKVHQPSATLAISASSAPPAKIPAVPSTSATAQSPAVPSTSATAQSPAVPSTSAGCIPIRFEIPDDQNSQNMDDDVEFFEASDDEGKAVQAPTSRDAMAANTVIATPSPSSSENNLNGTEQVLSASNGTIAQERVSFSQEGNERFAATQHLDPDGSDVEIITLDSSDDEGKLRSGKARRTKENLKLANASPGSSSQESNKTSEGKGTEGDMDMEVPGPSTKETVIKFAKTQRLTADTSDIEVIELDSDDDEQPASSQNVGTGTEIDLEQGNGSKNLNQNEDDEDDANAYRFTQALDELAK